jgi:hypothetical protein
LVFFISFFSHMGPGVNTPWGCWVKDGAVRGVDIDILGSWWWWNEDRFIITGAVVNGLSAVIMQRGWQMSRARERGLLTRSTRSDHIGDLTDVRSGRDLDDGLDIKVDGSGESGMVMDGGSGVSVILKKGVVNAELSSMLSLAQIIMESTSLAVVFDHHRWWTSLACNNWSILHCLTVSLHVVCFLCLWKDKEVAGVMGPDKWHGWLASNFGVGGSNVGKRSARRSRHKSMKEEVMGFIARMARFYMWARWSEGGVELS